MNLSAVCRLLNRARRSACEAAGIAFYSRPALNGLDRKLERHMDFDDGFFVEAGANDGVRQSNTYYFEKFRGWTGLLIEPEPELAAECRRNRRVPVIEAALTDVAAPTATVELHCAGLMSVIDGALATPEATEAHVRMGLAVQRLKTTRRIQVPARTLSSILAEARIHREIDLLSLDVEGAEPAALRGIDFARYSPRFICVEARDVAVIASCLEPRYRLLEVLVNLGTYRDLLYVRC